MRVSVRVAAVLAVMALGGARAEVFLPYLIADHMVVQRGSPVHIWGKAAPGEAVSAAFRGATRPATADALGRWSVYFPPGEAGGPFELTVRGTNAITVKDVLVGDVWVASGQSNMEWPLRWAGGAGVEMAGARFPRIRLARAMHKVSGYPLDNLAGKMWVPCTPETVADFSAVAYHFGRQLLERNGVPIGLIQTAWGGTPVEAWTSIEAIAADASLMPVFAEWAKLTRRHPEELLRYHWQAKEWEAVRARAKASGAGDPPGRPERPRGPGGPWMPGGLFDAMVAPLTPYPIRGVIWYQGEANGSAERAPMYGRLFQTLIRDWRRAWGQGDFPFLFVQLANYWTLPEAMWPELREAQRQALALANTAMAVTIDIGDPNSIHPANKREVGRRLALAARAVAYGEKIEYSGPLFRQVTAEEGALRAWFDHAGGGLVAKGGALAGFEIAGPDRQFVPADAAIEGGTVVVRSPAVPRPAYLRYAWRDDPAASLYNTEGLPASPFRAE